MDDIIKTICEALIENAEAVMKNTSRISSVTEKNGPVEAIHTFAINRLDEVEHIQNLTLELTKVLSSDGVLAIKDNA